MQDIAKGMETRIIRKDIVEGRLDVLVEFQQNLHEFERYNLVIQQHNQEWRERGSPKDVFDPVHGDIYPIKDAFVDPAHITSRHHPLPDSVYDNTSCGDLTKARPEMDRKGFVKIQYQLSIEEDLFIFGYAAYDYKNRIIYYNEVSNKDLSYLVRRSVQEIWGNHLVQRSSEPVLEGISYLIQGRKIDICKRDNKVPRFLKGTNVEIKTTNELTLAETKKSAMGFSNVLFGYVIPAFLILYIIVFSCQCLTRAFIQEQKTGGTYLIGMVFIILGIIASRWVSQWSERKVSAIDAESKFM